jgi:putative spermidine/putrescine transport system permease protein
MMKGGSGSLSDHARSSPLRVSARPPEWTFPRHAVPAALLLPSLLFLTVFFALPALGLLSYSFLTQSPTGILGLPLTMDHYRHFFGVGLYSHVLMTTLRISLVTTFAAVVLGYPFALVMVRGNPLLNRALTMIVIAPLIVSVVVRTYGWQLILGNGKTGILNWLLLSAGLTKTPVALLYTETAVVIGSLHVFFPMMVLPLASALGKIDPHIGEAARTLGATSWRIFRRITLPLSLPGLAVGCGLVFSLTAGSFVTPAILGGSGAQMLGMLVDQQILVVYDWPFGATVATVLVAIVLVINIISSRVLDRRARAEPA